MSAFWSKNSLSTLKDKIGSEKVKSAPHDLILYGFDATTFRGKPSAVIFPESTSDVQHIVSLARDHKLKIIPRGAGSGLSGGSVPSDGGLVISFERMRQIESIDPISKFAVVQPGVITLELQKQVAKSNLFYPPDPSSYSISTIGGNVAENAGGLRCFKYGVTSHYVIGLEYVNWKSEVVGTGIWNTGYQTPDLTHLLIGSEGTLGIISKIAVRLIDKPQTAATIVCYFKNVQSAFESIESIIANNWLPSVLEYIDGQALAAAGKFIDLIYPSDAGSMLLIEVDGSMEQVSRLKDDIISLLSQSALEVKVASDITERDKLWAVRRNISPSLIRLSSGKIHEDVAVPRGQLAKLAGKVTGIGAKYELKIPVYGHAGDGNLHVVILYDNTNTESTINAKHAAEDVFKTAIDLGGTITGEHGIGLAKRKYLSWQHSELQLQIERNIKTMMDPEGIFNPMKAL